MTMIIFKSMSTEYIFQYIYKIGLWFIYTLKKKHHNMSNEKYAFFTMNAIYIHYERLSELTGYVEYECI